MKNYEQIIEELIEVNNVLGITYDKPENESYGTLSQF